MLFVLLRLQLLPLLILLILQFLLLLLVFLVEFGVAGIRRSRMLHGRQIAGVRIGASAVLCWTCFIFSRGTIRRRSRSVIRPSRFPRRFHMARKFSRTSRRRDRRLALIHRSAQLVIS